MAYNRAHLAGKYSAYHAAARPVETRLKYLRRAVEELQFAVKTQPGYQDQLDIASCELIGVEAHLAALQSRMADIKTDFLKAVQDELPGQDPEKVFLRLVFGHVS